MPIVMENNNPPAMTCHQTSDGHPAKKGTNEAPPAPSKIPAILPGSAGVITLVKNRVKIFLLFAPILTS
jgi:hypothetical protein